MIREKRLPRIATSTLLEELIYFSASPERGEKEHIFRIIKPDTESVITFEIEPTGIYTPETKATFTTGGVGVLSRWSKYAYLTDKLTYKGAAERLEGTKIYGIHAEKLLPYPVQKGTLIWDGEYLTGIAIPKHRNALRITLSKTGEPETYKINYRFADCINPLEVKELIKRCGIEGKVTAEPIEKNLCAVKVRFEDPSKETKNTFAKCVLPKLDQREVQGFMERYHILIMNEDETHREITFVATATKKTDIAQLLHTLATGSNKPA